MLPFVVLKKRYISFIERIPSVVFGFFENWRLVVFIFVEVMQHMFLFLRNKHPILLIGRPLSQIASHPTLTIALRLRFSGILLFFLKIGEAIDELFGEERFILMESIALGAKGCAFNVLYLELDGFGRDGRDAYIKIVLHKFIL